MTYSGGDYELRFKVSQQMQNVGVAYHFFLNCNSIKWASDATLGTHVTPHDLFENVSKNRNSSKKLLTSAPSCVVVTYSFSELHTFWHRHSSWNCGHIYNWILLAPPPKKLAILKNVRFSCIWTCSTLNLFHSEPVPLWTCSTLNLFHSEPVPLWTCSTLNLFSGLRL